MDFFSYKSNSNVLKNIIICEDSNAHRPFWRENSVNNAVKFIESLILNDTELAVTIPPNLNTYFTRKSSNFSTIDLQIVSRNIYLKLP